MSRKEEALLMSLQHAVDMALGSPEVSIQYIILYFNNNEIFIVVKILYSIKFCI